MVVSIDTSHEQAGNPSTGKLRHWEKTERSSLEFHNEALFQYTDNRHRYTLSQCFIQFPISKHVTRLYYTSYFCFTLLFITVPLPRFLFFIFDVSCLFLSYKIWSLATYINVQNTELGGVADILTRQGRDVSAFTYWNFTHITLCVCAWLTVLAQDNLWASVLSLHRVGSGCWTYLWDLAGSASNTDYLAGPTIPHSKLNSIGVHTIAAWVTTRDSRHLPSLRL